MVAALEVSTTLPPWQNVVAPPAVIVGLAGNAFTVTVVANDAAELHPLALVVVNVNVPLVLTLMFCVVAPLLQR